MQAAEAVLRAYSQLKVKTKYILGAGGQGEGGGYPHTKHKNGIGCDCSGFVCWCLGLKRYGPRFKPYDGHMNTDSIIMDATGPQSMWYQIAAPVPGCAVIYPGRFKNGVRTGIGHMGLVTGYQNYIDLADWRNKRSVKRIEVVDCAGATWRKITGYAIAKRDLTLWAAHPDTVFALPKPEVYAKRIL